jgi:chromosomal replication initiator protein
MAKQSLKDLWTQVLTRIEPTIQRMNFVTWFQNTAVKEVREDAEGKVMVVGVPTTFAYDWVAGKYKIKVLQAAKEIDDKIVDVEFEVMSSLMDKKDGTAADLSKISSKPEKKVRKVRNKQEVHLGDGVKSKMLNARYTLDSFVIGSENRLPHAASSAVVNMPGGIYNPMYIYGGVGLGKTHMLQAIGNAILHDDSSKVVRYLTTERFVSEVVECIRNGKMGKFKNYYRNVDVLLIDDVQFFFKKKSSQEEFFHTFNELYEANKQIVLTSDRPPSELEDLDKRLTSRFVTGMVTELVMPEYETRVAILQAKAQDSGMILDPEVLEFVAANVTSSVRELEAVLRQVIGEAQLEERVPTIKSAVEVFKKLYRANEIIGYDIDKRQRGTEALTSKDVMEVVATYYRVTIDDLVGEVRKKEVMVPRQVCMYIIKHELDESYEKIGADFGGRMHTTVMNACNKVLQKIKKDSRLVRDINAIKREMGL